jgi:inosine-uridine nucleoside N-ribohydrolase
MGSPFSSKLIGLFTYFQEQYYLTQNFEYPVAHDPCTIYYLLHPHNFEGRDAFVEVELSGKSRGRTNCTFPTPHRFLTASTNSFVCERINRKHFWEVMLKALRKIK